MDLHCPLRPKYFIASLILAVMLGVARMDCAQWTAVEPVKLHMLAGERCRISGGGITRTMSVGTLIV